MGRFEKVIDTEGRVFEPLECGGYWILWEAPVGIKNEGLVRLSNSMPIPLKGGRSKASPATPLCLGPRGLWLPDRGGSLKRLHRPNRYEVWLLGFEGKPGFKVIPTLDAFASMRAL
jgi:hypothetical protein